MPSTGDLFPLMGDSGPEPFGNGIVARHGEDEVIVRPSVAAAQIEETALELADPALPAEPGERSAPSDPPEFSTSLLALSGIKGLGRKGLVALVDALGGDLGKIWSSEPGFIREALEKAKTPNAHAIASEILSEKGGLIGGGKAAVDKLGCQGIVIVPFGELPPRLAEAHDGGPRWLFVEGKADILYRRPAFAVVGTRTPTPQAMKATSMVARVLASYPITLVSGLAEGIDAEAHAASLEENVVNVAFLGHGTDHVYPSSTHGLRSQIIQKGGVVASEYLHYEHPQKPYFVERNRLQVALADVVIPVEANPKGGTAHTVRFARETGRRIVGVRWPGANGMLPELERAGYEIIDIFERSGRKRLDAICQELVEGSGRDRFPLSLLERKAVSEIGNRSVRMEDVDEYIRRVREAAARLIGT